MVARHCVLVGVCGKSQVIINAESRYLLEPTKIVYQPAGELTLW